MPNLRHIAYRLPSCIAILLLLACAHLAWAAPATQPMLPSTAKSGSMPLLPYLDYYLDESGSMDIEEIAAPELADSFAPFSMEKLPAATGVLWLRFTIAPLPAPERGPVLVLDIGPCAPGAPMLYEPEKNELSGALEWREIGAENRNIMLLPEAGQEPIPCYLRLDGLPGLWFSPIARTPRDAASNWDSLARPGAVLALGVVMFLCLLRGITERGQWRVWTALYVFFALLQALAGMPPQVGNPGLLGLAAILSPGIALMLLPHVGRHLLRARENSRALDIQLLLLSLPGAAFALLPLVPGWSWLDRWLDLWPAATTIFVPTALAAWLMGLSGSRRFLLACLIPPAFVGAGILGLYFGVPANLLASAPLWGVALGALLLAATRAPNYGDNREEEQGKNVPDAEIINLEKPLAESGLRLDPDWNSPDGGITLPNLGSREDSGAAALADPNLRLIPADEEAGQKPEPTLHVSAANGDMERAIRAPLDEIMREGAALEHCSLPPQARKSAENMLGAAHRLAGIVSGAPLEDTGKPALVNFNLQQLLRNAHDAVAPAAENAGIGLGWYMPPCMPQLYRGACGTLGEILGMLLESSVRATTTGSVHLSARRVPTSPDPGHILFTVTDSGSGFPPVKRSSVALDRAWELVGAHNGQISMECGAQGTTIAFSLHFTPLEEEITSDLPLVAVLCENADKRHEIVRMLAPLDLRISESSSPDDLLRMQKEDPAGVLVVSGKMAAPAASDMLREFVALAREAGYGTCKILAVHSDNSQDRLLAASGFTHAIPEPLDTAELRSTVLDLVEYAGADYHPPKKQPGSAAPGHARDTAAGYQAAPEEAGEESAPKESGPQESAQAASCPPDAEFVPDEELLPEELLAEAEILARAELAGKSPHAEEIGAEEIASEEIAAGETRAEEIIPEDIVPEEIAPEEIARAAMPEVSHARAIAMPSAPHAREEAGDVRQTKIAGNAEEIGPQEIAPEPVSSAEIRPEEIRANEITAKEILTEEILPEEILQNGIFQEEIRSEEMPPAAESAIAEEAKAAPLAEPRDILAEIVDEYEEKNQAMAEPVTATAATVEDGAAAGGSTLIAESAPIQAEAPPAAAGPDIVKANAPETGPIKLDIDAQPPSDEDAAASDSARAASGKPGIAGAKAAKRDAASQYVSHWIGGAGEWVGEPVPIIRKPDNADSEKAAKAQNTVPENAAKAVPEKPAFDNAPGASPLTNPREAAKTTETALAPGKGAGEAAPVRDDTASNISAWSKSPANAVEWVGEPMPILKKNPQEDAKPGSSAVQAPGRRETDARQEAGDRQNPRQEANAGPEAVGQHELKAQPESNNVIADFMSKTISHVSSTLERLTRGSRTTEKPAARPLEKPAEAPRRAAPLRKPRPVEVNATPEARAETSSTGPEAQAGTYAGAEARADAPVGTRASAGVQAGPHAGAPGGSRTGPGQKPASPAASSPNGGASGFEAQNGQGGQKDATPQAQSRSPSPQSGSPQPAKGQVDPFILQLVDNLDRSIEDAKKAFAMGNAHAVADCAARISEEAGHVGLRKLSQMAECVMRAGRHGDMDALGDLLPELVAAVERNRITLTL